MKNSMKKKFGAISALFVLFPVIANAQWWDVCFDPLNTEPISPDWSVIDIGNIAFRLGLGTSGNVTWGPESPCGVPPGNEAQNTPGYIYVRAGEVGSDLTLQDDLVAITFGAPFAGNNWSYATVRVIDSEGAISDTKWGEDGFSLAYANASFTRFTAIATVDGGVTATLIGEIRANAARLEWRLTNNNATTVQVGLRQAMWLGMINRVFGFSGATPALGGRCYTLLPTGRPVVIERSFLRQADPLNFPKFVDFYFRQTNPYPGLRLFMNADSSTRPDQTPIDRLVIANGANVTGPLWNDTIIDDFSLFSTGYSIRFEPTSVPAGGTRTIVYYMELPWGGNDLRRDENGGYALSTEANYLIAGQSGGLNDLNPNPFRILAWVDNMFDRVDKDTIMKDVTFTLTLPPGLTLAPGEDQVKVIPQLLPGVAQRITWFVVADGSVSGDLEYQISCTSTPGAPKTVKGKVIVSMTPKVNLKFPYNLITVPFDLADDSFATTFAPANVVAYNWNALLQTYEVATEVERGRGQWVLPDSDYEPLQLNGATFAGGETIGDFQFVLRPGWNLIGNPFPYPVQLNQLNGVSSTNPNAVLSWKEMVTKGLILSTVYKFDPDLISGNVYKFSSDSSQLIQPGQGYWVRVKSNALLTLYWPPVYLAGLPGSFRSDEKQWAQNEKEWKLDISVRGSKGMMGTPSFGVAKNMMDSDMYSAEEPPMAPGAKGRVSFVREEAGTETYYLQDIKPFQGKNTYKLMIAAFEPGSYTLSWPEITKISKNVKLRLYDPATGQKRDMRTVSGYTFMMQEAGQRVFEITVEPGIANRAMIGNVVVSSSGTQRNAPITIQYTLTADAAVTVRVLNSSGKEVYSAVRNRAESAGVNFVSWAKRDNAGRNVAPGNYIVEVLAENAEGQRFRVTRPVIVIR